MAKWRRSKAVAPRGFSTDTLRKYAQAGASAALAKLREEIHIIESTFPELASSKGRKHMIATVEKKASRMTAAGRKAVSMRMKKYWAERRKVEKK
jgi:hypothetical protein